MTRMRAGIAALMTACAIAGIAASGASAASDVPCSKVSSTHYDCSFFPPGNGTSAGTPVQSSSGATVGYLNQGTNFILCQASGAEVQYEGSRNHYWAYTEADDRKMGWVSAVYASGGDNDEPFGGGVPGCGSADGSPPQSSTAPSPTPTPAPSPPAAPTQVPCTAASHGHHNCFFYTRGDGIHGGTPVFSGSRRVGYLNYGTNWVLCQQTGAQFGVGNGTVNDWWAYTEADNHKNGWVNAVFGRGGTDNGSFAGVPGCDGAHGNPPGAAPPAPTPPPAPKNMVILGDSYAAGEGVSPMTDGKCYRDEPAAYGSLVAGQLGYTVTGFEACGGATTQSVLDDQVGALSSSTTLVTITVGGDDADFIGVLGRCVIGAFGWTSPCHNIIAKETRFIHDQLPGRLDDTYATIRADAPNAKVVVVGYPHLWGPCADSVGTLADLRKPTDLLDDTIQTAAAQYGFTFVDPRSAFTGHSICDSDNWINGLHKSDPPLSFHPDAAGYRELARLVEHAL